MERITKGMCDRQAGLLNDLLDRPKEGWITRDGKRVTQAGHLFIEHAPTGYRLVEYANENGGENTPLGNTSYSLRELYNVLYAVREALYSKWVIVEREERRTA